MHQFSAQFARLNSESNTGIKLPSEEAKLSFMTRLPKKREITQAGEDKSLILRGFYLNINANVFGF